MKEIYNSFTYKAFLLMLGESFLNSLGWYFTIIGPCLVYGLTIVIANYFSLNHLHTTIITFSILQALVFFISLKYNIGDYLSTEWEKLQNATTLLEKEKEEMTMEYESRLCSLKSKEERLHMLLNTKSPFKEVASMHADVESLVFTDSANWLKYKPHPALTSAEEVKRMKKLYNQILKKSKEIEYKYEFILSTFPEIEEYVNNDQELLWIAEHFSYSEIDNLRDRRKDYLSEEEYRRLSEDQRSQLALDRYVQNRSKSKWQIGRDYEMCCAFHLIGKGYLVEMHGIKYQREDLGRDLIAIKQIGGLFGNEILIIQCKNWSPEHEIHENIIMQLFGTTIEYQLSHESLKSKITPVLMIPPYSRISKMALSFANKLNIKIERVPFSEFPRIKCNVNNGQKIYHLPFDQQYDRTEIKLKDEFFAHTVAEATSHGFRRAQKHNFRPF